MLPSVIGGPGGWRWLAMLLACSVVTSAINQSIDLAVSQDY
jgi:hypothetical protein